MMRADHRRLPFSINVDKNAAYPDAFTDSQQDAAKELNFRRKVIFRRKAFATVANSGALATHYQEIVCDRLYPGNVQLSKSLRQLVALAEEMLDLNDYRRGRTILRIDAGGGSLDEVNWLLARG